MKNWKKTQSWHTTIDGNILEDCSQLSLSLKWVERQNNVWFHYAAWIASARCLFSGQNHRKEERTIEKHLLYKAKSIYIWYLNNDFYIKEKIENVEVSLAKNGHFKKWNFITFSEVPRAFDSCSVTKCREIYEMQHLAFYQPYKKK